MFNFGGGGLGGLGDVGNILDMFKAATGGADSFSGHAGGFGRQLGQLVPRVGPLGMGRGKPSLLSSLSKPPNLMEQIFKTLAEKRQDYRQPGRGRSGSLGAIGGASRGQILSSGGNFIRELISSLDRSRIQQVF